MGPTNFFEEAARACGFRRIAGLDEAGRGPLAGPVVAAVVVLPRRFCPTGLDDSKALTVTQRRHLFDLITHQALDWAIGQSSEQEIDTLNILKATHLAGLRALAALKTTPDCLLTDALHLPKVGIPQRPIIKGDSLSLSIAAASVLAKVFRDQLMESYHERFPAYQFHIHKGYPTPGHLQRLQEFGPCTAHRQSFKPVRTCSTQTPDP